MNYSGPPTAYSTKIRPNTSKIKSTLLSLHGPKCAFCGLDVTYGQIGISSYYPVHSHPDNQDENNFVLACSYCNRIKNNKEPFSSEGKELIIHPYADRYWAEIQVNKDGIAEGKTDAANSTISLMELNRPLLVSYRKEHISDFIEKINDNHSAYDVYACSIGQIKELLKLEIENDPLQEYFYRMIYANVIASMEAYLSKTIIMLVLNCDDVFWRFVNKFDWNNEKVNVGEIKDAYDNMPIKVRKKLTEVIYHNLPKVRAMYKKILEIDILTDETDMSFLNRAVDIRHDIVHRNGRKNSNCETDEFHSISIEMIEKLICNVDKLIVSIETQLAVRYFQS